MVFDSCEKDGGIKEEEGGGGLVHLGVPLKDALEGDLSGEGGVTGEIDGEREEGLVGLDKIEELHFLFLELDLASD